MITRRYEDHGKSGCKINTKKAASIMVVEVSKFNPFPMRYTGRSQDWKLHVDIKLAKFPNSNRARYENVATYYGTGCTVAINMT
ncbi:hypothetical protein PoMZ_03239 [Pyricularia oryzae]|uniref:Uncharacterized protein n=1 Tax=Pyricularia oryzae TaxID=318829 RepID=A0A4P7NCI4_PYROR|nr:hypothetical protein PoMZ_03239 [Pyricularia oryzae]